MMMHQRSSPRRSGQRPGSSSNTTGGDDGKHHRMMEEILPTTMIMTSGSNCSDLEIQPMLTASGSGELELHHVDLGANNNNNGMDGILKMNGGSGHGCGRGGVERDGPYIPHVQSDLESDGSQKSRTSPVGGRMMTMNGSNVCSNGSSPLGHHHHGAAPGVAGHTAEDGSPSKDPRRRRGGSIFGSILHALLPAAWFRQGGGGPPHHRRSGSAAVGGSTGNNGGNGGSHSRLWGIVLTATVVGTLTYGSGYRSGSRRGMTATMAGGPQSSSSVYSSSSSSSSSSASMSDAANSKRPNPGIKMGFGIGSSLRPSSSKSSSVLSRSRNHKPRAFVCITGQLPRLELLNKMRNLFRPWHDKHDVEFDVALVLSDSAHTSIQRKGLRDQEYWSMFDVYDALTELDGVHVLNTDLDMQTQHPVLNPDYMNQRNSSGNMNITQLVERVQNHVRQFESLARCHYHMSNSGHNYDIVHRVRDDVGYYREVDYEHQMRVITEHPMTIASSDCEVHGGINDRGAFVSPEAAYDYFNHPILHMYTKPLPADVRNTEQFLMVTYGRTCRLVETDSFHLFRLWEHNGTTAFSNSDVKCITKKGLSEKSKRSVHLRREFCRDMADGKRYCIEYDKKFRTYIPKDYTGTDLSLVGSHDGVGGGEQQEQQQQQVGGEEVIIMKDDDDDEVDGSSNSNDEEGDGSNDEWHPPSDPGMRKKHSKNDNQNGHKKDGSNRRLTGRQQKVGRLHWLPAMLWTSAN